MRGKTEEFIGLKVQSLILLIKELLDSMKLKLRCRKLVTALRYIDKDNFECPELGVVQKCPMILGEYHSPGGKEKF